ncbi:glycoside hydrolase family 32 protein [Propioniciclava soli]|uniref:glycoside hydrolase family 32 protein n=1 Tax=Propioniciclava soli TaxID=2775081 RepID=UPI001E3C355D|nr:glycoside hydrolase family 32 protein [Propioniciclava soli]
MHRRVSRRGTWSVKAATGVVAFTLATLGLSACAPKPIPSPSPTAVAPTPTAVTPSPQPGRPALHITPPDRWINDPQRPFFRDGQWHLYHLYNADYPDGNGTSWYHLTSTDLVHWRDEGVAIEKYRNGLGDIWTGSAVVDTENTAGYGAGAVLALATQQHDGVQVQSLFHSADGGFTFASADGNPVMPNPGVPDFRDPKVFWDAAHSRWVMALAEGDAIGFYTSPDLRAWTYRSRFTTTGLGVLECPDLFPLAVDDDPGEVVWVLMTGANGAAEGFTTGTAAWLGEWDGEAFTSDGDHQWVDAGPDFYAATTWEDPRVSDAEQLQSRYLIGWMNNWNYATDLPAPDWAGGTLSLVRELALRTVDGQPRLVVQPLGGLDALAPADEGPGADVTVTESWEASDPLPDGAYRLRVTVARDDAHPARETRLLLDAGDGSFITVGYDFAGQRVFVARDTDAIAATMPEDYRAIRSAPLAPDDGAVDLDIIVDDTTVEVFAGGGEATLSSVVHTAPGARGWGAASVAGVTRLLDLRVEPLAAAPVQQP